jgi:hypothetical protein
MEIFHVDEAVVSQEVDIDTLKKVETDGISIRIGNRVVKLSVTDEVILPDEELKKEYEEKLEEAYTHLNEVLDKHKNDLTEAYKIKERKLNAEIEDYQRKSREISVIPDINISHAAQGLSVVSGGRGRLVWYFNCVYAPKFINERRIDPKFAKRLMTPITIQIHTDRDLKASDIVVRKIIGHEKFVHYHSVSANRDCWGDFIFSGEDVSDADKALTLAKRALVVLETINEFSLGTTNPRGLSRFDTLKKHLLEKEDDVEETRNATNSRNRRSGFDTDVNNNLTDGANVWSV